MYCAQDQRCIIPTCAYIQIGAVFQATVTKIKEILRFAQSKCTLSIFMNTGYRWYQTVDLNVNTNDNGVEESLRECLAVNDTFNYVN